ncbi:uncharacterized protein LOC144438328 isoform X2 [Glandiceps talaboti]
MFNIPKTLILVLTIFCDTAMVAVPVSTRRSVCPLGKYLNDFGDCAPCRLCKKPGFTEKQAGCATCLATPPVHVSKYECEKGYFFEPRLKECHSCVACSDSKDPRIRMENGCLQCEKDKAQTRTTLEPTERDYQPTTVPTIIIVTKEDTGIDSITKPRDVNFEASHSDENNRKMTVWLFAVISFEGLAIIGLCVTLIIVIKKCRRLGANGGNYGNIVNIPLQDRHPPGKAPDNYHIEDGVGETWL